MKHLKSLPQWVVWKLSEDRKKIPYNPLSGTYAKPNDIQSATEYETALKAFRSKQYNGIGFLFFNGICGIDIDIKGENAAAQSRAKEILEVFSDTYIEQSPSGSGYHIIFKCDISKLPLNTDKTKLSEEFYTKNPNNGLEIYFSGLTHRYFTYTGEKISSDDAIIDKTDCVLAFLKKYMTKEIKTIEIDIVDIIKKSKKGKQFAQLYDTGDISSYQNDESSADLALCNILAFFLNGNYDEIDRYFRQSKLYRPKWERQDYRERTIKKAISGCNGNFYTLRQAPPKRSPKQQTTSDVFSIEILKGIMTSKGISVRFNDIKRQIDYLGFAKGESKEHIAETLPITLYDELRQIYKKVNKSDVSDFINVLATRNRYNPVLEYLNKTKYDGGNYLSEVYSILNIADSDTLSKILIKKWLWQCISLLNNDISKPFGADGILTIIGDQGIGKTSFFRKIAILPEWFGEGIYINFNDKDTFRRAGSYWITELGEVESTLRQDVEKLKAFVTSATDEYRLPYAKNDTKQARRTSLCATCNSDEFLIDQTGNRRFFTVPVDKIDLDRLNKLNALQLWKQIQLVSKSNLQGFRLTDQERQELANRNLKHKKLIKGEAEVRDIIATAQSKGIPFELMTVTDFKIAHEAALRPFSAQHLGIVLNQLGIAAEKEKNSRVRRLPRVNNYSGNW